MACNYYRDRDGFCHLQNRCWSGKPCPTSQAAADLAREQLCNYFIRVRAGNQPPAITRTKQGKQR